MSTFKEIRTVTYQASGISRLSLQYEAGSECFPAHWHNRLEILHILSGKITIHFDNKTVAAEPEQTVIIAPFMNHSGIAGEEGVRYEVLTFDIQKFFNESSASKEYLNPLIEAKVSFLPLTSHPEITKNIQELLTMLDARPKYNPLCTMGKMYEIIGLIYQHCIADSTFLSKPDEKFTEVIEYINIHFTENITTRDISKKFSYDNTYFCRRFKALTGITTMKYIHLLRLKMAANLLSTTNDNIKDIAWKCGFSDISHLSNSFKKHYLVSPAEYRKHAKH